MVAQKNKKGLFARAKEKTKDLIDKGNKQRKAVKELAIEAKDKVKALGAKKYSKIEERDKKLHQKHKKN
jgi:hypothetical protein